MSKIEPEAVAEQIVEEGALETPEGGRVVGRPLPRKEDARLVTGQTRWTDNIQLPARPWRTRRS
jgi:aerobic carbon-monoxide dehydrogenase large subunit